MRQLKILSICLVALALHSKAWAEIYETKDAEGNTEFTDSPPTEDATVIEVQQTNIADAPAPDPEDDSEGAGQPAAAAPAQAPVVENNINIEREGYEGGVYPEGEYPEAVYRDGEYPAGVDERALRRDEAVDPDAPREVGDSEAQMRREVGDSEAQRPREVGDRPTGAREEYRR
jgi:Domain of unknown function (DUF4124)